MASSGGVLNRREVASPLFGIRHELRQLAVHLAPPAARRRRVHRRRVQRVLEDHPSPFNPEHPGFFRRREPFDRRRSLDEIGTRVGRTHGRHEEQASRPGRGTPDMRPRAGFAQGVGHGER